MTIPKLPGPKLPGPKLPVFALALMSAPLLAAPIAQETDRTITVTGERFSPSDARKRSNDFVIDVDKSVGYPLAAVADYAAMVSTAQVRNDIDFAGMPSILSLFSRGPDAAQSQAGLTRFDKAYLSSLNSVAIDRGRLVPKSQIVGRMAAQLGTAER